MRERGVDMSGMTAEQMRPTLAAMVDFKLEKSNISWSRGDTYLPSFQNSIQNRKSVGAAQTLYKGTLQIHDLIFTEEIPVHDSENVRF